ncbi:MAG: radical SAM protein [Planctomycetota bacterium]
MNRREIFGLVLSVTHDCNLRCAYCNAGPKSPRAMPEAVGRKAVDRALASLRDGGTLDLGFYGGEPLLEPIFVSGMLDHAGRRARERGISLLATLTTNGTIAGPEAWKVLTRPDLDLAVSHDGLPDIHDRHRRTADGKASSEAVLGTMQRLREAGKEFRVVMVVRPDGVDALPDGIRFLRGRGVRRFEPSLDLHARWTPADRTRLEAAVERCAGLWLEDPRAFGIGWLEEKVSRLARLPCPPSARCGFGDGEIAVAPSGRLYPCERLIGADDEANPMRLPGHALEGEDFPGMPAGGTREAPACLGCPVRSACDTACRCANFARTGEPGSPDALLCSFEKACIRAAASALGTARSEPADVC